MPKPREPLGTKRDRFLVILVGVVVGYVLGLSVESRLAWENARILVMIVGGLVAGVIARFTLARFRSPPDSDAVRRSR